MNWNWIIPLPGAAIDAGVAVTETPLGIAFAETAGSITPLAPPKSVVAMEKEPLLPRWIVSIVAEGVTTTPATSTWMVLVTMSPSPVADIEMGYVPGKMVVSDVPPSPTSAVMVSVDEPPPAALNVTALLLQEAVR